MRRRRLVPSSSAAEEEVDADTPDAKSVAMKKAEVENLMIVVFCCCKLELGCKL